MALIRWQLLESILSHAIASQLKGWVAGARTVLSCRLNVWEADINALEAFETYRTWEFDYPAQVEEFISRWFQKSDTAKGERLRTKLAKSERSRLRDLVKNPYSLCPKFTGNCDSPH